VVTALERDARVKCLGLSGFEVDLAQNVSVAFRVNNRKQTAVVEATQDNLRPVIVRFIEGGHLEMKAGAESRIEFFANKSFMVRGTGEALAVNGDGHKTKLSDPGAFMAGGALVLLKNKAGVETLQRVSPIINVKVSGTLGTSVKISAGGYDLEATGKGKQTLRVPELSGVMTFEDLQNEAGLYVHVEKGELNLTVEGISNWSTHLSTDQSARIIWNRIERTVDVKNLSVTPLFVQLPAQNFVELGSGGLLQYTAMPGRNYATAASGADARMFSRDGTFSMNLRDANQLFSANRGEGPSRKPGLPIHLNWDTGAPLGLTSPVDYAELKPGSEHVVRFEGEGEATIYYTDGGWLNIEASEHKFTLVIAALNGLLVNLEAGDTVSMILDKRKGTFTLKAGIDNSYGVDVDTLNGFAPIVDANKAINFNVRKDGSVTASVGGLLVNFDPPDLDPLAQNAELNPVPDRIDQQPLSLR
jgi:hypothetical protein